MEMLSDNLNRPVCRCGAKKRVLIVDDDPQTSQDHAEDLRDWGYEPVIAEGPGLALLEDARVKARQYCCRVAIVDMRLFGAGDESGLALASQLAPTVCVIVTAYGSIEAADRSRPYDNIARFFEKGDDPARLNEHVRKAFEKFCGHSLSVEGPGYRELLSRTLKDIPDAREDEIMCALAQLYRDEDLGIKTLHLVVPDAPYPSQTTAATPARSAVYVAEPIRMDGRSCRREVVKVAEREKIEREVRNYKRWIKPFVLPNRCARIEDRGHSLNLWHVGAIRYTDIAQDDRQLFRAWYARASGEQVTRAIKDLFERTLAPLHNEYGDVQTAAVYDYYVNEMFTRDFETRIHDYCAHNARTFDAAPLLGTTLTLRDPIWWALEHREQSSFRSRWQAPTHGDLHGGNIFVDDRCETYVLDYERSGPGYILRDFVELEADICLRLTPIPPDRLGLLYALNLALLAPVRAGAEPDPPIWQTIRGLGLEDAGELQKAFDAVCALRQLARRLIGQPDHMKQYYWALLMETLISVLRKYSDVEADARDAARRRALLSAALVAERLARWNADWPPRGWPRPENLTEQAALVAPVRPDEE